MFKILFVIAVVVSFWGVYSVFYGGEYFHDLSIDAHRFFKDIANFLVDKNYLRVSSFVVAFDKFITGQIDKVANWSDAIYKWRANVVAGIKDKAEQGAESVRNLQETKENVKRVLGN